MVFERSYVSQRLATETLDPIQKTPFPSKTDDSILIRSLISKHNLDADYLRYKPSIYQTEETLSGYRFLKQRLVELYKGLNNPTPRGY